MSLYLNNSPSTILSSFENLIVGTVGCDWAAAGSPFSSEHLLHIYSANWKSFVIPRSITLSIIQLKNCADCAAIWYYYLIIRKIVAAWFAKNYAAGVPPVCRLCRLAEAEVVATVVPSLAALPTEFLDGDSEIGEVRYVAGSQVILEFILDGCSGPEVILRMLLYRLENLREHQLWCRLLLELLVVTLNLTLIVARKPVDAVGGVQLSDGLGIHLLVGYLAAHVDLCRHLHAEVAAGAVARG